MRLRDSVLSAAPDDEDRMFDREEALRLDDEIMDFHWFSSILGRTSKTYEVRHTSNHQLDSGSLYNKHNTLF